MLAGGTPEEDRDKLALKIIKKERITSFSALSNEVFHLHTLRSPYVVKISDCIHTSSKLYIVTERWRGFIDFSTTTPKRTQHGLRTSLRIS